MKYTEKPFYEQRQLLLEHVNKMMCQNSEPDSNDYRMLHMRMAIVSMLYFYHPKYHQDEFKLDYCKEQILRYCDDCENKFLTYKSEYEQSHQSKAFGEYFISKLLSNAKMIWSKPEKKKLTTVSLENFIY